MQAFPVTLNKLIVKCPHNINLGQLSIYNLSCIPDTPKTLLGIAL